jgi:hypothetical protein
MGFWNNMAHAMRNTRVVFAILMLSVVLGVLLYQTRCTPAVVSSEVLSVPVLDVRRMGDEAHMYHLQVGPVGGDMVWVRWHTREDPPALGESIRLRVTVRANGERDFWVLRDREY